MAERVVNALLGKFNLRDNDPNLDALREALIEALKKVYVTS